MADPLTISCRCGKVRGRIETGRGRAGTRLKCYCKHCQAFLRHLGAEDIADEQGGTELLMTLPGRVHFDQGQDEVRSLRLSRKGVLRWYAGCCGTPLGNTMPRAKVEFTSIPTAVITPRDEAHLGPLRACANTHGARGPGAAPKTYGQRRVMLGVAMRHIATRLGLAPRGGPFFDESGNPVVAPHILSDEERAAAYNSPA